MDDPLPESLFHEPRAFVGVDVCSPLQVIGIPQPDVLSAAVKQSPVLEVTYYLGKIL